MSRGEERGWDARDPTLFSCLEEMMDSDYYFCGCTQEMMDNIAAWNKKDLVVSVAGTLPTLSREEFAAAVKQALDSWAAVSPLRFTLSSDNPDIILTTGRIDGSGKVLAWSELPDGSDRMLRQRYDTSERFVIANSPAMNTIDIVAVLAHEFGHAFGLDHAPQGSSDLMAPIYQPARREPQDGDIARIQKIYGKPLPGVPTNPNDPIIIKIFDAREIQIPGYKVTKE